MAVEVQSGRTLFRRKLAARVPVAFCVFVIGSVPAFADYKLGPGDTLTLTVAGLPELTTKSAIDIDGNATFPLLGPVAVAGTSVADVLNKVQAALPAKQFRRHTEDGREFPVIISPSDIGVTVLEYRPVYVNGDVAKPGEEPYRPGLTVRKSVALAGGFDILRFKLDNPFVQLSDLTSDYNSLWVQYAQNQAVVGRLQAELDGSQQIDPKLVINTPIAPSLAAEILNNEKSQLSTRNADFAKEKIYLTQAVTKEVDRAQTLSEEQVKEQEGLKNDTADLQRYNDLFSKGAVALPSLSEARRTVLQASTRVLQTTSLLDSVEREKQDLNRRLERVGDARRMQVLTELQTATTSLATLRSKLQAVSEKLRYTGMVKSQLVRGGDSRPKVTIVRIVDARRQNFDGDLDTTLEPGDTVEVALQAELPPAVTQ